MSINFNGQQSIDVEIYNILGEIIYKETVEATEKINVSNFTPGTYFVKLISLDFSTVKKCIIKGN